jgi:hypothetical protein
MTDETKNQYHFNKIFELSNTKVKEELPKEWRFLFKEESDSKDKMCICQRKIQYSYIFANMVTSKVLRVGSTCKKNLQLKYPKIDADLIKYLNGDAGEYGTIESALELSEDLRQVVIDHFEKKYWSETNIENLRFVVRKIEELISIYRKKQINTNKLLDLLDKINTKIIRLITDKNALEERKKREKEEEIERERRWAEENERRRKEYEREKKEEEENQSILSEIRKKRDEEQRKREAETWRNYKEKARISEEERQKILNEWSEYFTKEEVT